MYLMVFFPLYTAASESELIFPRQAADAFHKGKVHIFSFLMRDFGSSHSLWTFTDSKLWTNGKYKPFAFSCLQSFGTVTLSDF